MHITAVTDIGGNFPALGWNAHQVVGLTAVQQFAHTIPSPVYIHTFVYTNKPITFEEAGPLPSKAIILFIKH